MPAKGQISIYNPAPVSLSTSTVGLVLPGIIILSIDDGFSKFSKMRGLTGDCWENSRHEVVCYNPDPEEGQKLAECKFWRNFCK